MVILCCLFGTVAYDTEMVFAMPYTYALAVTEKIRV